MKHGGIKEILATKQCPGVAVRGDRKGRRFDDVAPKHRVSDTGGGVRADGSIVPVGKASLHGIGEKRARAREQRYADELTLRNRLIADQGGQKGKTMRHTHSIPAELFHGKIRESGDPKFWDDPKNRNAATGCKVRA